MWGSAEALATYHAEARKRGSAPQHDPPLLHLQAKQLKHDLPPRGILLKHSKRIMLSNTSGRQMMMNADEIMLIQPFRKLRKDDRALEGIVDTTTACKPRQAECLSLY